MATNPEKSVTEAFTATVGFLLLLALIPLGWIAWAFNDRHRTCVQLKNGMVLGYEAVFDLGRPYFKPIVVPKYPDGKPLIRDEVWAIFISDTTIYGLAMRPDPRNDYRYAWRTDTDLVMQDEQPELFDTLVSEAGNTNWDYEIDDIGPSWLLNDLVRSGRLEATHCQTSFLTW